MIALILKEIKSYLSSITGYLAIVVYLLINALFLWVFPGNFNILDAGYASIQSLFIISPWVFMFLIPAITMRMIADEKKTGTMEFLFTKPITEMQIVLAKFLAAMALVFISLIPTIIYYVALYFYGDPVGNLDSGASLGSYFGLFFLGASYCAIGIFASSLTENQIVAFILALFLCFFFYTGFDSLASFDLLGSADIYFKNLGISQHFSSMSRGVLDSRDPIYFISLSAIFLLATQLKLQSRKWA